MGSDPISGKKSKRRKTTLNETEPHLASQASARARYRQQHPQELALLAQWSGLVAEK
jgi:hypothetical protein